MRYNCPPVKKRIQLTLQEGIILQWVLGCILPLSVKKRKKKTFFFSFLQELIFEKKKDLHLEGDNDGVIVGCLVLGHILGAFVVGNREGK